MSQKDHLNELCQVTSFINFLITSVYLCRFNFLIFIIKNVVIIFQKVCLYYFFVGVLYGFNPGTSHALLFINYLY